LKAENAVFGHWIGLNSFQAPAPIRLQALGFRPPASRNTLLVVQLFHPTQQNMRGARRFRSKENQRKVGIDEIRMNGEGTRASIHSVSIQLRQTLRALGSNISRQGGVEKASGAREATPA
jgi:hypothetical protein